MSTLRSRRAICAIYTGLWTIYSLQMVLGLNNIGQPILFLLILYSLYKVIYVLINYKIEPFMKALTALLILFTIYGIFYICGSNRYVIAEAYNYFIIPPFYYLKYIYCSIPVVYVYYDFAKKGVFSEKIISNYTIFFVLFAIFSFFSHYALFDDSGSFEYIEGVTNNAGYKFVAIIPLLFISKKYRPIFFCICFIFPIFSLKRGAIIIACIGVLMMYRFYYKQSHGEKRLTTVLLAILTIIFAVYFMADLISTNSGIQKRIEMTLDGYTSGRDDIAQKLIDYYVDENEDIQMYFGNGADATVGIAGNYAHNDWIEILINQGVIGVIIYLIFYIVWYTDYKKLKRSPSLDYSYSFGFSLIYFFLCSLFSMAYTAFSPSVSIAISVSLLHYRTNNSYLNA